jgi:hypothetical protein
MRNVFLLGLFLCLVPAGAQTQLNYSNQIKSATKPVKTGTVLPGTCVVGDLFVKQGAPVSANLYACAITNTWTLQAGGIGGALLVQADGSDVGSRPIQNFDTGTGILAAIGDTGSRIDIFTQIDPAVVQTRTNAQSGHDVLCESQGTVAQDYTCSVLPVLSTFTRGMILQWIPDVTASGGPVTLTVNALDGAPVKLQDGTSNPTAADVTAGRLTPVWFDGTSFRLLENPGALATESQPACSAGVRGRVWYVPGSTGMKDDVAVCAKDATNAYAWRVIY